MKFSRHWLWLLLLIPISIGFMRLRLDVEVMNLLPDDYPVVRGLKLYQTDFANARELIITVDARESETAENAARTIATALRAATNLTAQVTWQPLWLENPGQSAELVGYLWYNQPPEVFRALTQRLAPTNLPVLLRDAQEALTTSLSPQDLARRGYDPFNLTQLPESVSGGNSFGEGGEFFASPDGTFRLVFAEAKTDLSDYRKCTRWLNEIKGTVTNALHAAKLQDSVKVMYTGRPAFVSEISSGMQQDLAGPSGATLLVIAVLFYLTHRRFKPLLWLTVLLLLILAGTMALGGLIYGTLNIISLGFASILLGLAEDFGIVLYQESRSHPELSLREVRRMAAPGIFWSAVTTCGAFLMLNFGGLPGLGQLGTLVAVGIALAAIVMLYAYLPPLMRKRAATSEPEVEHKVSNQPVIKRHRAWLGTAVLLGACAIVLFARRPVFDNSPDALRPRNSTAYAAISEIKQRLQRFQEPLWVLITGQNEAEVLTRLQETELALARSVSNGLLTGFTLPTSLWPNPANEQANRTAAASVLTNRAVIRDAVLNAGFTSNSLPLTENIFRTWQAATETTGVFWPTNDNSRWILDKLIARKPDRLLALGLLYPNTNAPLVSLTPRILELSTELSPKDVYVSGWEILGYSVFARVKSQFWQVLLPMVALVVFSLWLAFRNFREMLLSLITLVVSALCLWALMGALGWSWNLLNLMALPLLLGIGVDFSIHIQFALKRYNGDLAVVRGSIGRALLLAGSTTVAGFASLAFSNNAGMASLGKVCGTGIICAMLVSVYLLPLWWRALKK
jgi:uncharacterized protein